MKTHGMLFCAAMVRAWLDGRKGMTRRICKNLEWVDTHGAVYIGKPIANYWRYYDKSGSMAFDAERHMELLLRQCPWSVGDRVYCKETFKANQPPSGWIYRATDEGSLDPCDKRPWKPSIFMPRVASRLWFEIVGIKVERLQDISEEDARAEGIERHFSKEYPETIWWKLYGTTDIAHCEARMSFRSLWQSIHGPESWDASPWVWCLTFKPIEKPI